MIYEIKHRYNDADTEAVVADDVMQMNVVLKEDFEKKMSVVGLLKQYAEQRDVDTFARGLSLTLSGDKHQPLLQHIRLLACFHCEIVYHIGVARV